MFLPSSYSDGANQALASCQRDFRNKPYPVRAKITYYQKTLTVSAVRSAVIKRTVSWWDFPFSILGRSETHLSLGGVRVLVRATVREQEGFQSLVWVAMCSNPWPLGLHLVSKSLSILLWATYYVHTSLQDTGECKAKVIFQRACNLMRETLVWHY